MAKGNNQKPANGSALEFEEDGEPFAQKMKRLTMMLDGQFSESAKIEKAIKVNLKGLGYGL